MPRVRRCNDGSQGWQVRFQVLGKPQFRYFADRQFGSAEAAHAAAIAFATRDLGRHRELLALHRRLAPRATCRSGTPGVARYDASASRGAHWMAYVTDPVTGRRRSARFSISRHGELGARQLARAWRARAVSDCLARYHELLQQLGRVPVALVPGLRGRSAAQITSL